MTDLMTQLREHDLPPKWDGLVVLWRGWEYQKSGVFLCPPPKVERCDGCKAPTMERGFPVQSINRGRVAVSAVLTIEALLEDDENRVRLGALAHRRRPRSLWRLYVWRCPACLLDTVWDVDTDETWALDHTDYGDKGSTSPSASPERNPSWTS